MTYRNQFNFKNPPQAAGFKKNFAIVSSDCRCNTKLCHSTSSTFWPSPKMLDVNVITPMGVRA